MSDYNPFQVLGLPVRPDLTDDEIRAAWRIVAAKTHPDLPDGGDPDRFSLAAAAYADLRTPFGRTEAYADLGGPSSGAWPGFQPGSPPGAGRAGPGLGPVPETGLGSGSGSGSGHPAAQRVSSGAPASGPAPSGPEPWPTPTGAARRAAPRLPTTGAARPAAPRLRLPTVVARLSWRLRRGRPLILVIRLAVAGLAAAGSFAVAGVAPATLAIVVGLLTWLVRTSRYDLAPR